MIPFSFTLFKKYPNLIHGVSTAEYGNMSYLYGPREEVQRHRKRFFDYLRIPIEYVAIASLLHGDRIIDVDQTDRGRGVITPDDLLEGDVLVTNKPDTYLFFVVADCLALLFFDPVKQVCALAHAGWRGVDQQVPGLTVKHLVEKYGCDSRDILVGMSPSIAAESACFADLEQNNLPHWQPYIVKRGGKYCADSRQFAYDQLLQAGIKPESIECSSIDTRHSPDFYSHRRSAEENIPEARFGAVIGFTTPKIN